MAPITAPSNTAPPAPVTPIYPGKSLSFFILGSSLHSILTRLKSLPHFYPTIDMNYSSTDPIRLPVIITLPENGVRLRFDGPDQRLRLIEVLEDGFARMGITYKGNEVVKLGPTGSGKDDENKTGPTFRHVYHRLFGPSYPGEYLPPPASSTPSPYGTYILSYPGVAFCFPLLHSAWSETCDFVSLLSSSAALPATAMSIFSGKSWADARRELYTRVPPYPRNATSSPPTKGNSSKGSKDADEVEHVKIHGAGKVEVVRRSTPPFIITLNETTPIDLVAELGPPDAICPKADRRIQIHKSPKRTRSESTITTDTMTSLESRSTDVDDVNDIDIEDGDHADEHDESEEQEGDEENDSADADDPRGRSKSSNPEFGPCFFEYHQHGFDLFISHARPETSPPLSSSSPSPPSSEDSPSTEPSPESDPLYGSPSVNLTVTKVLLHGNVPGTYSFNRHRRCRWSLVTDQDQGQAQYGPLTSETPFPELSSALHELFKDTLEQEEELKHGMVLNRVLGESPESSINLLGGWEDWEDGEGERTVTEGGNGGQNGRWPGYAEEQPKVDALGNTVLYGFPGLLFEVLGNGAVSCLTVY